MELETEPRTRIVSLIGTGTLAASFVALFFARGVDAGFDVQMPETLFGIIILGAGGMLLIENLFDRDLTLADPQDLQFLVGVPGSLLALVLGFGYFTLNVGIVNAIGGFEGGIYLGALIILLVERLTSLTSLDLKFGNLLGSEE